MYNDNILFLRNKSINKILSKSTLLSKTLKCYKFNIYCNKLMYNVIIIKIVNAGIDR